MFYRTLVVFQVWFQNSRAKHRRGIAQPGTGGSCEGKSLVDTIGVYEFDTESETVVATHIMEEGFGGDPYPTPDGSEFILLR